MRLTWYITFFFYIIICSGCIYLHKTPDGTYTNRKAQKDIVFLNPSFEWDEYLSTIDLYSGYMATQVINPAFWENCVNPNRIYILDGRVSRYHNSCLTAQEGDIYVGLGAKGGEENGLLSQQLSQPIKADFQYFFIFYTAFAQKYIHYLDVEEEGEVLDVNEEKEIIEKHNEEINQDNIPTTLRIWGSNDGCELEELLHETHLIDHLVWKRHSISFKPRSDYDFIVFEPSSRKLLPGQSTNILLDNLSIIKPSRMNPEIEE